jgi:CRP-like cAMP-binding protein
MMHDPLVERLQQFAPLADADKAVLSALTEKTQHYPKRADILRAGDPFESLYLLRRGWACRYAILPGRRRQIIGFVIPGDLLNVHVMVFEHMEHFIGAITPCEIGVIPPRRFMEALENNPPIGRALYWSSLVTESVLRERIVTLGRRSATQRVAHLFCELLLRLRAAGLAKNHGYDLPLTQSDIADTLGLNHVHVNRILRTMRKVGVIKLRGHLLEIPDWDSLTAMGEFDPQHLGGFVRRAERTNAAPEGVPHV